MVLAADLDSREFSRLGSWEFSRETDRREVDVLADLLYSLSRSLTAMCSLLVTDVL